MHPLKEDKADRSQSPAYLCGMCGGGHKTQNCKQNPNPRKPSNSPSPNKRKGKDKGKGKGGDKGKGKGKGKGKPKGPPGLSAPQGLCPFFQTKWHGGKCIKENCPFQHQMAKTQEEYDAIKKPWEREGSKTRNPSVASSEGSAAPKSPNRGTTPPPKRPARSRSPPTKGKS